MPTAVLIPDAAPLLGRLSVWLAAPETRRWLQGAASDAGDTVDRLIHDNKSIRTPRQPSERAGGFRTWLAAFDAAALEPFLRSMRFELMRKFQDAASEHFPDVEALSMDGLMVRDTFLKLVWPPLEAQFRERAHRLLTVYAVRSLGLTWLSRSVGDTLLVGSPEQMPNETGWMVPVFGGSSDALLTTISLDRDGNVTSMAEDVRRIVDQALS